MTNPLNAALKLPCTKCKTPIPIEGPRSEDLVLTNRDSCDVMIVEHRKRFTCSNIQCHQEHVVCVVGFQVQKVAIKAVDPVSDVIGVSLMPKGMG